MTDPTPGAANGPATGAAALNAYRDSMPFAAATGVQFIAVSPAEVIAEMEWTEQRCTIGGALHGGALMTLADAAGAVCAFVNLPDGAVGTTTIESKTNLMGSVRSGKVRARAVTLHVGRTTIVIETEVRAEGGKLVSKTTQTQAVLRP